MADQLRWDAVGAYGNPVVSTPNLDRLAREGVRFGRAYVTNPFCMPSRASILTGRWPHAHGLWDNGVRLPPDTPTLATALGALGYRTAIVGKGHLDVHGAADSPDRMAGWDDPALAARWEGRPYYGFQEQRRTNGHNQPAGQYGDFLYREHPHAVPLMKMENALEPPVGHCWKSALPVELHSSTYVGDNAVEFIRRQASAETPFFLWASFPDPHEPFCPPRPYCDMYDPAAMPPPLRRPGETLDKPPHFRGEVDGAHPGWRPYGRFSQAREDRSEAEDRYAKALYYGMVSLIDHNVGRILAALEETGQLDDTIVVYVSDHGELLGDHWLYAKGPWHYDACTRVPLMVRYPAAAPAGRVVDDFVSLADLVPTLCELTGAPYTSWPPGPGDDPGGVPPPGALPDVQGISLVPALRGEGPGRSQVMTEFAWRFVADLHQKTLRTRDWRITAYAGRPYGELYDLREDPDELVNRWDDPALRGVRGELTAALLDEVMRTESRWPPRVAPN